eukprot:6174933-Pleurochrysis_carterae.AAC.1
MKQHREGYATSLVDTLCERDNLSRCASREAAVLCSCDCELHALHLLELRFKESTPLHDRSLRLLVLQHVCRFFHVCEPRACHTGARRWQLAAGQYRLVAGCHSNTLHALQVAQASRNGLP